VNDDHRPSSLHRATAVSRPKVVLTGFMGTGKSAVGQALALRLGYEWVDTDGEIESRHGGIPEIFATRGENEFRRYERQVAGDLAERDGLVISTGGRMMLDADNAALLTTDSVVICLVASAATILRRIGGEVASRPLLAGPNPEGRINALLAERAEGYGRFRQLDTSDMSVTDVVDGIVAMMEELSPPE
jgi:shikimate kinase